MLLRNKKASDPNEGKWIGIGGKFEEGETPDECMLREVREETGIVLSDYHFHGVIEFRSDEWEDEDMYLYTAHFPASGGPFKENAAEGKDASAAGSTAGQGQDDIPPLPECREGTLKWIPKAQIMSLKLWEGDRIFLKELLDGKQTVNMRLSYCGERLEKVQML